MVANIISGALIVVVVPAAIYLVAKVFARLRRGKGSTQDTGYLNQRVFWWHTFEVDLPREAIQPITIKSLEALNRKYKLDYPSESEFKLIAKTGLRWRSTGEIIAIGVARMPNSRTRIDISSNPNQPDAKYDWGVNEENVAAIVAHIRSHIEPDLINRDELMEPRN